MTKTINDEVRAESDAEYRTVSGEYEKGTPSIVAAKISLANPESIRQEMARVYRQARAMKIDSADAAKLIYMLSQIAKAYELGVIEQRLNALEATTQMRRIR